MIQPAREFQHGAFDLVCCGRLIAAQVPALASDPFVFVVQKQNWVAVSEKEGVIATSFLVHVQEKMTRVFDDAPPEVFCFVNSNFFDSKESAAKLENLAIELSEVGRGTAADAESKFVLFVHDSSMKSIEFPMRILYYSIFQMKKMKSPQPILERIDCGLCLVQRSGTANQAR